jgi:hypothetical protein
VVHLRQDDSYGDGYVGVCPGEVQHEVDD